MLLRALPAVVLPRASAAFKCFPSSSFPIRHFSAPPPAPVKEDSEFIKAAYAAIRTAKGLPDRAQSLWRSVVRKVAPLGGSTVGNRVTMYFDGDSAFQAMFREIESARKCIFLQTYVLEPDPGLLLAGAMIV